MATGASAIVSGSSAPVAGASSARPPVATPMGSTAAPSSARPGRGVQPPQAAAKGQAEVRAPPKYRASTVPFTQQLKDEFGPLKGRAKKVAILDFERPLIELDKKIAEVRRVAASSDVNVDAQIAELEERAIKLRRETYAKLEPFQRLQMARHPNRPTFLDIAFSIADGGFVEMHGDRHGHDDAAIACGFASVAGQSFLFVGHQKGRNTRENVERNFGMPHPFGYRKALRFMKLADRHGIPIVTFVDTPGAFAGRLAEDLGQGEAIAFNLREMFSLRVPVISLVIGEGGSGGALAIGIANKLLIMENAVYYVASPEACAAILWKSAAESPRAASALKITSRDLVALGIMDSIVPEPLGGSHTDPVATYGNIKKALLDAYAPYTRMREDEIVADRYARFRRMGRCSDLAVHACDVAGETLAMEKAAQPTRTRSGLLAPTKAYATLIDYMAKRYERFDAMLDCSRYESEKVLERLGKAAAGDVADAVLAELGQRALDSLGLKASDAEQRRQAEEEEEEGEEDPDAVEAAQALAKARATAGEAGLTARGAAGVRAIRQTQTGSGADANAGDDELGRPAAAAADDDDGASSASTASSSSSLSALTADESVYGVSSPSSVASPLGKSPWDLVGAAGADNSLVETGSAAASAIPPPRALESFAPPARVLPTGKELPGPIDPRLYAFKRPDPSEVPVDFELERDENGEEIIPPIDGFVPSEDPKTNRMRAKALLRMRASPILHSFIADYEAEPVIPERPDAGRTPAPLDPADLASWRLPERPQGAARVSDYVEKASVARRDEIAAVEGTAAPGAPAAAASGELAVAVARAQAAVAEILGATSAGGSGAAAAAAESASPAGSALLSSLDAASILPAEDQVSAAAEWDVQDVESHALARKRLESEDASASFALAPPAVRREGAAAAAAALRRGLGSDLPLVLEALDADGSPAARRAAAAARLAFALCDPAASARRRDAAAVALAAAAHWAPGRPAVPAPGDVELDLEAPLTLPVFPPPIEEDPRDAVERTAADLRAAVAETEAQQQGQAAGEEGSETPGEDLVSASSSAPSPSLSQLSLALLGALRAPVPHPVRGAAQRLKAVEPELGLADLANASAANVAARARGNELAPRKDAREAVERAARADARLRSGRLAALAAAEELRRALATERALGELYDGDHPGIAASAPAQTPGAPPEAWLDGVHAVRAALAVVRRRRGEAEAVAAAETAALRILDRAGSPDEAARWLALAAGADAPLGPAAPYRARAALNALAAESAALLAWQQAQGPAAFFANQAWNAILPEDAEEHCKIAAKNVWG